MNLPSYADRLAGEAADIHIELAAILAAGVTPDERPRLDALAAALPHLVNGLDYLAVRMDLVVQQLRRGPAESTPDKRLRTRLADLERLGAHDKAPSCNEQPGATELDPT